MTNSQKTSHNGRFASLLSGKRPALHIWDTALLETPDYVVTPTRGSIVQDWLLVVPKRPALNFAEIRIRTGRDPLSDMRHLLNKLGVSKYVWFEHGAAKMESDVGCGVDYAHLHVISTPQFSFDDFKQNVEDSSSRKWSDIFSSHPIYGALTPEVDYYAFGDADFGCHFSGCNLGRQFFRKVVASLVGKSGEWDYNLFEHVDNIEATIGHFSRLADAA